MNAWLMAHGRALRSAVHTLVTRPMDSLFNVLTLAAALALPAFSYLVVDNLRHVAGRLDTAPQMSVFLTGDAGNNERGQIEQLLKGSRSVERFRLIGREEALRELKAASASADPLAGLPGNPLPDAYLITLASRDKAELDALRARLARLPGAASVELDSTWVERVDALIGIGKLITLLLAFLLGFAALMGIINTIRLQVLTRKEELEVGRLFGATEAFLRRPFLYFGALQAGLAGLAAWAVVAVAGRFLEHELAAFFGNFALRPTLHALTAQEGGAFVGLSAMVGWIGALVAVLRHVRA